MADMGVYERAILGTLQEDAEGAEMLFPDVIFRGCMPNVIIEAESVEV